MAVSLWRSRINLFAGICTLVESAVADSGTSAWFWKLLRSLGNAQTQGNLSLRGCPLDF